MSPVDLAQLLSNLLSRQGWIAAHKSESTKARNHLVASPHDFHGLTKLVDTHQTVFLVVKGIESFLQLGLRSS